MSVGSGSAVVDVTVSCKVDVESTVDTTSEAVSVTSGSKVEIVMLWS